MELNRVEEILFDISSKLSGINTSMTSVLNQLAQHENRITNLERLPSNLNDFKDNLDMKNKLLKWLTIALIASISVIVTLTGSAAFCAKIFSL